MPDVFVSYKSEERALVLPLVTRLRSLGLEVWFDTQIQIGNNFDDEIDRQLRSARAVIVCWSQKSVQSDWVLREATVADLTNTIVPVFLENIAPPGPFARREGSKLVGWSGETSNAEWRLLLASLQRLLERDDLLDADEAVQKGMAPPIAHFRQERSRRARRRLLSLDAAGSRVFIQLACLRSIEAILRDRENNPELVLADYFDLIGGTALGGLVACQLAFGRSVSEIQFFLRTYLQRFYKGNQRLRGSGALVPRFVSAVDSHATLNALEQEFGALAMSAPEFKTGFALCMKRVDSGTPWIVSNNSLAIRALRNQEFLVRNVVAACIARPGKLEPVSFTFGSDRSDFIDGMFAGLANPALELLKITTLPEHQLNWRLSEDELFVVSVGAGSWRSAPDARTLKRLSRMGAAEYLVHSLIGDTIKATHETMLMLSHPPQNFALPAPLLSYRRFDCPLNVSALSELLGRKIDPKQVMAISGYSEVLEGKNLRLVCEIGEKYAEHNVLTEHFPSQLDVRYEPN